MKTRFTSEFFTNNRKTLTELSGSSLIVLSANGLLQRSADTTFSFRQDSNFWYLTGINEADYVLVISEGNTFLIAPKRSEHRDLWDGVIDKEQLQDASGISNILEHHDGWIALDKLIKKYKKIHTIAPVEAYFEHLGFFANPARGALQTALKKHRSVEIVDVRKTLARMRQVKQLPELQALQQAIDITVDSLTKIKLNAAHYTHETELAADITADFIRAGAIGHAYHPIIASGLNAATIHYINNNEPLKKDGLILMDVGAEVNNYSADITRTYAFNKPTARQRDVYNAVLSVKQTAENLLKPGIDMKKYEQSVDEAMAIELKSLKLIDDVKDKKKLKKYYPHLTSHFLGLDTHDAADYTIKLEPGMVVTVEPGIYIPDEAIGIRIEDDVLITKNGIKNLSANLSVNLD
ncbi:MAG: Xaa-Pro peptidase family protein [bacterium]|nr:Xaa-Pro peptidase family protein [bacterium]